MLSEKKEWKKVVSTFPMSFNHSEKWVRNRNGIATKKTSYEHNKQDIHRPIVLQWQISNTSALMTDKWLAIERTSSSDYHCEILGIVWVFHRRCPFFSLEFLQWTMQTLIRIAPSQCSNCPLELNIIGIVFFFYSSRCYYNLLRIF